jgi:hypothetical protein
MVKNAITREAAGLDDAAVNGAGVESQMRTVDLNVKAVHAKVANPLLHHLHQRPSPSLLVDPTHFVVELIGNLRIIIAAMYHAMV